MDYDLLRITAYFFAALIFYAVLSRGLYKATETFRWGALEIAERLLHSAQVTPERKNSIQFRLDEVHSSLQAWKLVLLMVSASLRIFSSRKQTSQPDSTGVPNHLRDDYERFIVYWMVSIIGNSVAAAAIFTIVIILFMAFSVSIKVISRSLVFSREHGDHHHREQRA